MLAFPLRPHADGRPQLMGIVNVTPDSFSDGGRHASTQAARDHALRLLDEGADCLDIGGESTRPGAEPVSEAEELDRVIPVIEAIRAERLDAAISIDTMKPGVARAAVHAGAGLWNDVNALRAEGAPETAMELGVPVCLMHMQGEPRTMQADPHYDCAVLDVYDYLLDRIESCERAGISRDRICIDPGIGFGKTLSHNLELLSRLAMFHGLGCPILLGTSRKSFIGKIDPKADPKQRLGGSIASAVSGWRHGVQMIRVHDVQETVQALSVSSSTSIV